MYSPIRNNTGCTQSHRYLAMGHCWQKETTDVLTHTKLPRYLFPKQTGCFLKSFIIHFPKKTSMFLVPALWPATQEWGYRDVSDAPVTPAMDSEGRGLVQVGTEELRCFLWWVLKILYGYGLKPMINFSGMNGMNIHFTNYWIGLKPG